MNETIKIYGKRRATFRVPEPDVIDEDFDILDGVLKTMQLKIEDRDKYKKMVPFISKLLVSPSLDLDKIEEIGLYELLLFKAFSEWITEKIKQFMESVRNLSMGS